MSKKSLAAAPAHVQEGNRMKLDNITQFFRPIQTPLENIISFYSYCWRTRKSWRQIFSMVLFVLGVIGFFSDMTDLISGSPLTRLLTAVGLILPWILSFVDFVSSYENRFTSVERDPDAYSNITPQNSQWERIDLRIPAGLEPVFRSDAMDDLLCSTTPIPLQRDTTYEKNLRRRIQDKALWESTYYPFLRHNHRNAMYTGKQFYNEKKYGISQAIDPDAPVAKIHKTCYFDSYLTNIIPGQRLTYNKDGENAADACGGDFMPYHEFEDGHRQLRYLGDLHTANEPGVTTLLITPRNEIILWRQNRLAQCSNDLLVASGSGSANWDDCKKFIGDSDGLRKTVIWGMERELWEESNGNRATHWKPFHDNVETRITGYFRWLKKGAKSEFVGVSRLKEAGMVGLLKPEASEVFAGDKLNASSIQELIESIDGELSGSGTEYTAHRCSVSCSMALYSLRRTCSSYCQKKCPYQKDSKCTAEACNERPFKVLFQ